MSTRELGILSGMEKAAAMTPSVDHGIRKLRAQGMDRAAQGLRTIASPSATFTERGEGAAKVFDAAKAHQAQGKKMPGWMAHAMSDAVADNKDLDARLRRLFDSHNVWMPKSRVKPTARPRKPTNAQRLGGHAVGAIGKMPKWKKGLLGTAGAAALAAGAYGMSRP